MTSTKLPYTLMDCTEQNAKYPDTFEIPDPHQIEAIRPGDHVKLIFEANDPDPDTGMGAERMWVQVTTVEAGHYTGTLDNMPCFVPLEYGETVEFTSANIASVMPSQGDAMVAEFHREPDVVVTEEQAIAEGVIREMDAYGIATFRGQPVRTVSDTLFRALQDAFGLAASAGITMTGLDWQATLTERAADGQTVPAIDDLDGRIRLVPPWATLGELLQVFIEDATDTAQPGEPQVDLYMTPPLKALDNRPIWLQWVKPGGWTAFLPEDY